MANDIFQINQKDLKKLIKFYKRAPKPFTKAAAGVLNAQAFENRKENIVQLKKSLTIRNEKFVAGSLRVTKAKGTKLNNLMSIEGSIERRRFTGWAEQELGKPAKRKRLQTVHARGGSFNKRVQPKAKMKRSNKILRYQDFRSNKARSKGQATVAMLKALRAGAVPNNPAIIESGLPGRLNRFKLGLYKQKRRSIKRLQNLNPRSVQPKRNRWMTKSLNNLDRRVDLQKTWAKSINIELRKARI